MKITMIHGQNHIGSTCHMGRMLAEQFDAEVSEFFLPKSLNHFCLGCYNCIENEENCPFYSEKRAIMASVEEADLLIFTTPTYCMRCSAPMKSFLDLTFTYWMSHRPRGAMFSKKAVVISSAAGAGAKSAAKDITTALLYWGIPWVRAYGVAVQAMGWDQIREKKKAKIEKNIQALARQVQSAAVRPGIKTRGIFYMMRMMIGTYDDASEEKKYWAANGWLDKARPWA